MLQKNVYFFIIIAVFLTLTIILLNFNANKSVESTYSHLNNKTVETDPFKLLVEKGATKNFVFIDLGANKGDSIYNFFGIETKDQNPYNFPRLIDRSLVNQVSWIVYAFEANPVFDDNLYEMKKKLNDKGHKIHLFNRTAAWTYAFKYFKIKCFLHLIILTY